MAKIGYQWYVDCGCEVYVPEEYTYPTLDEIKTAIEEYLKDSPFSMSACGIDKVEDDNGYISVIEKIVVPTSKHWEE
jgi:hypothetical protein